MSDACQQVVRTDDGALEFACPRCGRPTRHRFYGPCPRCYEELGSAMGSPPAGAEPGRIGFEPKMNVTPNFVATRD